MTAEIGQHTDMHTVCMGHDQCATQIFYAFTRAARDMNEATTTISVRNHS